MNNSEVDFKHECFHTTIPLVFVSSNEAKRQVITNLASKSGCTVGFQNPLFDENEIKNRSEVKTIPDAIMRTLAISATKLSDHRKAEDSQPELEDALLLVTDSILLAPDFTGVDRDGVLDDEKRDFLEKINRERSVYFCGVLSFGNRKGETQVSVTSIVKFDFNKDIDGLPLTIEKIRDAVGTNPAKVGLVSWEVNDGASHLKPLIQAFREVESFDEARPYISGLVPEVVRYAHEYGAVDAQYREILGELVGQTPFNTLVFYSKKADIDLLSYYQELVHHPQETLHKYGGNCALKNLALALKMKDKGEFFTLLQYPSWKPHKPNGHAAILLRRNGHAFLMDPGLGIPYVLPVTNGIPIAPIRVDNKRINIRQLKDNNNDGRPDIFIERPRGLSIMPCTQENTFDEYINELPAILIDLHKKREIAKIEFNDRNGSRLARVEVNRKTGLLKAEVNMNLYEFYALPSYQEFEDISHLFDKAGYDGKMIIDLLRNYYSYDDR